MHRRAVWTWSGVIALAWLGVATASADDVWVGQPGRKPLKYSSVEIRGDQAGELVFRGRAGNLLSKPVEQIARVNVADEPDVGKAESLFEDGDHEAALPLYERVARKTEQKWLKRYATARLVTCYDETGRLGDAVRAWIETLKVWPTYALTLRPIRPAEKGSKLNAEALALIAEALEGDLTSAVRGAIEKLQTAIWRAEGDPRAEAAVKERVGDRSERAEPDKRPAAREEPAPTAPKRRTDASGALARATRLADDGRHAEAVALINETIPGVSERRRKNYLPRLLTLKANCLLAMGDALAEAGKDDQARRHYVYGGLAAMHVVTFFDESQSFVEMLFLAARCHEKIGRKKLAIALYKECGEFAVGKERGKWKRQAAQALERLDVKTERSR